jgi:hypothetical protein
LKLILKSDLLDPTPPLDSLRMSRYFHLFPFSCLASIIISPSASPRDPYVHLSGDMETSRNLEMYPPSARVRLKEKNSVIGNCCLFCFISLYSMVHGANGCSSSRTIFVHLFLEGSNSHLLFKRL